MRILDRLREAVPSADGPAHPLGLGEAELSELISIERRERLAALIPWRGGQEKLLTIAWWGSALGEIAAIGRPHERNPILREAALFNLGVALFDSHVDDARDRLPELASTLAPWRLRGRLHQSADPRTLLACGEPAIDSVAELFDAALSSIGQRWRGEHAHLEHLIGLLEAMYESELGLSSDCFAAKTLPIVFIGSLGYLATDRAASTLFESLGRFLCLWDDWLDQAQDFFAWQPSSFLGNPQGAGGLGSLVYVGRFLLHLAAGKLFHPQIARRMAEPLKAAFAAAQEMGDPTQVKLAHLCRRLLNGDREAV